MLTKLDTKGKYLSITELPGVVSDDNLIDIG